MSHDTVRTSQVLADMSRNPRRQLVVDEDLDRLGHDIQVSGVRLPLTVLAVDDVGAYRERQLPHDPHGQIVIEGDDVAIDVPTYSLDHGRHYFLLGGHRRFVAGLRVGHDAWPIEVIGSIASVADLDGVVRHKWLAKAAADNGWARPMTGFCRYHVVANLLNAGIAQSDIVADANISKGQVSKYAAINRLPAPIKRVLEGSELPRGLSLNALYTCAVSDDSLLTFACEWPRIAEQYRIKSPAADKVRADRLAKQKAKKNKSTSAPASEVESAPAVGADAPRAVSPVASLLARLADDDGCWYARRSAQSVRELIRLIGLNDQGALSEKLTIHLTTAGRAVLAE